MNSDSDGAADIAMKIGNSGLKQRYLLNIYYLLFRLPALACAKTHRDVLKLRCRFCDATKTTTI